MELGLEPIWKHPCHRHFNTITNSFDNFIVFQNYSLRNHARKGQIHMTGTMTNLVRVPSPICSFSLFGHFCKQGMAREGLSHGFFNFEVFSLLTESSNPSALFKI